MSETSPYDPPQAPVDQGIVVDDGRWQLMEPSGVAAGRGMGWISDGFRLFLAAPGIWIVNFIIFSVITIVLAVIPIISLVGNILGPIFAAGLLMGARALDERGALKVEHLFAGFQNNGGKLAGLGALTIAMGIGIGLVAVALMFGFIGSAALTESFAEDPTQMGAGALLAVLLIMGISVPVLMAYWFAPALIVFHDLGIFEALKLSFRGCLRNMLPFLVYGLVMSVAVVVAVIPLMLGFLVLVPVMFGSMYASYRDIFTDAPANTLLEG